MTAAIRYSSLIRVKAPDELLEGLREASQRAGCKPSETVRRLLIEGLQARGVDPLKAGRAE